MQRSAGAGAEPRGRNLLKPVVLLLVGGSVALTLGVAIALTFFAHPNGDDFCIGAEARELGLLGCVRRSYLLEGGRWAGYVMTCGMKTALEMTRLYPIGPLAMLAVCLLALRLLAGAVLKPRPPGHLAWSLAIVGLALYWAGVPHPGETFYWLDSSVPYLLSVALSAMVVAGLLSLPAESSRRHLLAMAGLALLAAFTAGLHELFALILTGVLGLGAAIALAERDPRRLAWLATFGAAGLSLAAVILAPGNEVRARGSQPEVQSVGRALTVALQMWLSVLDAPVIRGDAPGSHVTPMGWLVDVKLLSATLLFVTAPGIRSLDPDWLARSPRLWKVLVPGVGLGALTGSFLAGGWALGFTLPYRAFNALYLVFLIGWFLTAFVYTRGALPARGSSSGLRLLRGASAALLALSLLVSTNVKHGVRDLGKGWATAFDREMSRRYDEARRLHASGGGELVARDVDPWPWSYYRNDVRADPGAGQNRCWADYFGIDGVRLESSASGESGAVARPLE